MAFCEKFKLGIRKAMRLFDEQMGKHADLALKITTTLKNWTEGAPGKILDAIIPGDQSGLLKTFSDILGRGIEALDIYIECKDVEDPEEKLKCYARAIGQLQQDHPMEADAKLAKLGAFVTKERDGRYPQHIYDLFFQVNFSHTKPEVEYVKPA